MTCQKLPLSISRCLLNSTILSFVPFCVSLPVILLHCVVFGQLFFFCFLFLLFRAAFPIGHLVCMQTEGDTRTQLDNTKQSNLSHHGRGKATGACDETDKAEFSIHSACLAVKKKKETFNRDTLRSARVQYENPISESKEQGCGCRPFYSQSLYSDSSTTEIL